MEILKKKKEETAEFSAESSQLYAYRRKLDYTVLCLEKNKLPRGICAFGTDT